MATDRERERDRDVEFGKLTEAIANFTARLAEYRAQDQVTQALLFTKIEALQAEMNRYRGARGMALLMLTTLVGLATAVVEWVLHFGRHHH
jgi:hypothetical protein